jgi:choline dehydrogenase
MGSSLWAVCGIFTLLLSINTATALPHLDRRDDSTYDFIIVGGGTAGLTLASRLTEDGKHTVLVLEAGGRPDAVKSYQVPGADLQVLGSPIDWAFGTLPQSGLNGRQVAYNQGRCLGGSSAINGLAYTRGSSSIYDLWASLGNPGWNWESIFPYFKKVSDALGILFISLTLLCQSTTFNAPSVKNITAFDFDASIYSDGPVQIAYPPYVYAHPGSEAFVESFTALGVPQYVTQNVIYSTQAANCPRTESKI